MEADIEAVIVQLDIVIEIKLHQSRLLVEEGGGLLEGYFVIYSLFYSRVSYKDVNT